MRTSTWPVRRSTGSDRVTCRFPGQSKVFLQAFSRTSEIKGKRMLNSRNRKVRKLGLENVALFSRCTERQLRKISVLMTDLRVPAGRVLTRAGEPGYECFVIVS